MKRALIITLVIALLLVHGVSAQVSRKEAQLAINLSEEYLQDMLDAGFSATRVNDTLMEAKQIFTAQSVLEDTKGTPNYELVIEKTDEIAEIKKDAFDMYDEINALELTLTELEGINKTAIEDILNKAKQEFQDERYKKVEGLIEKAYEKISEEQAFSTKVAFFFETTQKNIVTFFMSNWIIITSSAIIIIVFLFLFHGELSKGRIRRKIKKLDIRKDVLNQMIKKLQHEYFELGKISEETYKVKLKKFEELMRDIERRKPLLREELESKSSFISRFRSSNR